MRNESDARERAKRRRQEEEKKAGAGRKQGGTARKEARVECRKKGVARDFEKKSCTYLVSVSLSW